MPEELTIGQLARASDVNVETIRFYEAAPASRPAR